MQNGSDKSGNNINQKIDVGKLGQQFVQLFYTKLNTNLDTLFPNAWKEFTTININGDTIKGIKPIYLKFKAVFTGTKSKPESYQFISNGSRSILILVTGKICRAQQVKNFSTTFQLIYLKAGAWYIQNMLTYI